MQALERIHMEETSVEEILRQYQGEEPVKQDEGEGLEKVEG